MKKVIGYCLVVCGIVGIGLGEVFGEVTPTPSPVSDCFCSVSGKVTDAITGKNIGDAIIVGENTSYTSTDGSYTWSGLEIPCYGGTYILTASAKNYISQTKTIAIDDEKPCVEETLDFPLIPSSTQLSIVTLGGEIETSEFTYPKNGKGVITVTVTANGEWREGMLVTAAIGKAGKRYVSITNPYAFTTKRGEFYKGGALFGIQAENQSGKARIVFKAGNTKKSVIVEVK